jgi:hypothetical protein
MHGRLRRNPHNAWPASDNLAKRTVTEGLFLMRVGCAQALCGTSADYHLETKKQYVNHYPFNILDRDWIMSPSIQRTSGVSHPGDLERSGIRRLSGAQSWRRIHRGRELFRQHRKRVRLRKHRSDLVRPPGTAIGEVRERRICCCGLCFAEDQKCGGFRFSFSNCQMEYGRNLIFGVGGRMSKCSRR